MKKILFSYLRFWAKIYLKRSKPEIIAVSGSVGKTSTKEAIFEVLKVKFGEDIRRSAGNLNTETGVPLAILGFKKAPEGFLKWIGALVLVKIRAFFFRKTKILVLEMAADKPSDIKYLTTFVKPKVAVLTTIGPAHLEAFGSIENIVQEKTDLLRSLDQDGVAILNIDDQHLKKISYGGRYKTMTYAIEEKADFRAENITTEIEKIIPKTTFDLEHVGKKNKIILKTLGTEGNVLSALVAAACGEIYELAPQSIAQGLKNTIPQKHRLEVLQGKNNSIIIDDTYNANPLSMKNALDVLNNLKTSGRKIAVLGGMLEIGKITNEAHKIIGQYADGVAQEVLTIGDFGKKYQTGKNFVSKDKVASYLLGNIKENDIILVKASRREKLEDIVEGLKK